MRFPRRAFCRQAWLKTHPAGLCAHAHDRTFHFGHRRLVVGKYAAGLAYPVADGSWRIPVVIHCPACSENQTKARCGMQVSDIQMLLAEVGWYHGAIDGDAGPKKMDAVATAWRSARSNSVRSGGRAPNDWTRQCTLVAAGQIALGVLDYEPGAIDGYADRNTE
ncbi:peptidoglycan-binding domain-containing protein [Phaeobacter inhibens]|uniref:peptidoglycan-binding domain-containing protein n=1 Tax=Phaeobacter inhibens TaxID=221822 RepID=UPI0020C7CAAD|nr:hypothetical protein [Phaeobacter inhibens]